MRSGLDAITTRLAKGTFRMFIGHRRIRLTVVLISCVVWAGCARSSVIIATRGRSQYRIATNPRPTPAQNWAVRELRLYIRKMMGVEMPVTTGDQPGPGPTIWIAPPAKVLRQAGIASAGPYGEEEYEIVVRGRNVYVLGGEPRGVIYGVYALLEDVWGCRWLTPDCEVVPSPDALELPAEFSRREKPAMEYRDILFVQGFDAIWAARNRVPGAAYEFKDTLNDKGGQRAIWPICHGIDKIIHPAKARFDCFSSEEVYRKAKAKLLEWSKTHPRAEVYDVSQRDGGHDGCHCKLCQPLIDREGSQIAPILKMANRLVNDAELQEVFRNRLLTVVAYNYSAGAPKTMLANNKVVVRLCQHSPYGKFLKRDFENIEKWSRHASRLWLWLYVNNWLDLWYPVPNVKRHAEFIREASRRGATGVMNQGMFRGNGEGDMAEMKAWVWAKIMWNPSRNVDELIDTFTTGYYGAAAKPVREYVNLMDGAFRSIDREARSGQGHLELLRGALSWDVLDRGRDLYHKAREAASDPVHKRRVETAFLPLRYARMINGISPSAKVVDGRYCFPATDEAKRESRTWYEDARKLGFTHASEVHKLELYERKVREGIEGYPAVELSNGKIDAVVVPEYAGRILVVRKTGGPNLLDQGTQGPTDLNIILRRAQGLTETFGRHPTQTLGMGLKYSVVSRTPSSVRCSAKLSNGMKFIKDVSLRERADGPYVHVKLSVTGSGKTGMHRLHVHCRPASREVADPHLWYKTPDGAWKEWAEYLNVSIKEVGRKGNPVVQAKQWAVVKRGDACLIIEPHGSALDMSVHRPGGTRYIRWVRFGFDGWFAKPDKAVEVGYNILVRDASEIE